MVDTLLQLQASVTKTASFNSSGVLLRGSASASGGGTPRRGLVGRVLVTAISGAPSVSFKVQHSDDNSTYADLATQLGAAFSASAGEAWIPFSTDKPYVRLVMTLTGGSSPSITYQADLGNARP